MFRSGLNAVNDITFNRQFLLFMGLGFHLNDLLLSTQFLSRIGNGVLSDMSLNMVVHLGAGHPLFISYLVKCFVTFFPFKGSHIDTLS